MTRLRSCRPAGRAGFSLIEIMIAMFVLSLGLILSAAAFPAALRSVAETQDITVSGMGGRIGTVSVTRFAGSPAFLPVGVAGVSDSCGLADEAVHWFGPAADAYGNGGTPRWVVDNPLPPNLVTGDPNVGWGRAIPFPSDERYAIQIFYRRVPSGQPPSNPPPSGWPMVYIVSVVTQLRRDGTFAGPVSTRGDDTQLNAVCASLQTGDVCCTWDGRWFRYSSPAGIVPGTFGWGIPGGIGVYHTLLELNVP
jgi:prepilin-type N-terminal cleavage/methylation domain-containing protein